MTASADFFVCGLLYTDDRGDGGPAVEFRARMIDRALGPDNPGAFGHLRVVTSDGRRGPWKRGVLDMFDWPRFHTIPHPPEDLAPGGQHVR